MPSVNGADLWMLRVCASDVKLSVRSRSITCCRGKMLVTITVRSTGSEIAARIRQCQGKLGLWLVWKAVAAASSALAQKNRIVWFLNVPFRQQVLSYRE